MWLCGLWVCVVVCGYLLVGFRGLDNINMVCYCLKENKKIKCVIWNEKRWYILFVIFEKISLNFGFLVLDYFNGFFLY